MKSQEVSLHSAKRPCWFLYILVVTNLSAAIVLANKTTLDQAIDIALNRSSQGAIIKGRQEVAEQAYYARRINFMLPEISINGNLPAYSNDESYRQYFGATGKSLFKTRDLDFNSFIELRQNLPIVGGNLTATANLSRMDNRYPNTDFRPELNQFIEENSNRGFFNFTFEQQLFRPSAAKNELHNREDDADIARLVRHQEQATLKKEVIEAYLSLLRLSIKQELYGDKLESAQLKVGIDSLKLQDGIISEEDFLLSSSARLDAELESSEIEAESAEMRRELAMLLDTDVTGDFVTVEPVIGDHLDQSIRQQLIAAWENSVPILKAEHEFAKAKRSADYAAAGHGLTGDLKASYSFGRQKIETERFVRDSLGYPTDRYLSDEDINTAGWGVSLEFKLPLWDGGAGGAAVKAARFEAEQARLQFTRESKKARADIVSLVNQLDVTYRRLGIIRKQIDLAKIKLNIAESRLEDGQISMLTFLESRIFYLETRDRYLEELRQYLIDQVELESKFISS